MRDFPADTMTADISTLTRRHALKLALLYLMIRGIPELAAWVWVMIPDTIRFAAMEGQAAWALRLLPPQPLGLFHAVPMTFHYVLNSASVLTIEVLLVFLLSLWMLRRRPGEDEGKPTRKAWLLMVLATLAWSVVLRYLILGLLVDRQLAQLDSGLAFDALYAYLFHSYWLTVPAFYLSAVVWAGLPPWLHFRALGRSSNGAVNVSTVPLPLKQALVGAGFFLGFILLHYALVQGLGVGLWSWIVDTKDIFIPTEELQGMGLPLVFSQILAPTAACALAAYLYSRSAHWRADSAFQLVIGPALAGVAVLAVAHLICLALLWMIFYIDYGLAAGIVLGVAYRPELGYALLIGFNVFSLVLLCCLTLFLRGPRMPAGPLSPGGRGLSQA